MTEQEARAIASRATGLYAAGFISADDVDAKIAEAFAHHRAAVRAETLREVRGVVEGIHTSIGEVGMPPVDRLAPSFRHDILTALDALTGEVK